MLLISRNYKNVVLVTHQFNTAIKVVIFENSLQLLERRFYRICGVGKDLKYRSTSAPLPPCTCLLQAGLRQTRRLQDLGQKINSTYTAYGQLDVKKTHKLPIVDTRTALHRDIKYFYHENTQTILKKPVCIFISVGGQDILDPAMPV